MINDIDMTLERFRVRSNTILIEHYYLNMSNYGVGNCSLSI